MGFCEHGHKYNSKCKVCVGRKKSYKKLPEEAQKIIWEHEEDLYNRANPHDCSSHSEEKMIEVPLKRLKRWSFYLKLSELHLKRIKLTKHNNENMREGFGFIDSCIEDLRPIVGDDGFDKIESSNQ